MNWILLESNRNSAALLGPGFIGVTGVIGVIGVKGVGMEVAPEILLPHELDALESILDVEIELQFG